MSGDDYFGSDELSAEQLEEYEREHLETLSELEKMAQTSQQAREFLSTQLGRAIRKEIMAQKILAMKALADNAMNSDFMRYKHHYDVVCGVENIFTLIISDGEQALASLRMKLEEEGDTDG